MSALVSSAISHRFAARKAEKTLQAGVRMRQDHERRLTRVAVARALKLLARIAGAERDPFAIARCLAPGGVWAWPFEADDPRHGRAGAWLRRIDGVEALFVRVDDEGAIVGDSLYRGIAVALRYVVAEHGTDATTDAIREAVRAYCEGVN